MAMADATTSAVASGAFLRQASGSVSAAALSTLSAVAPPLMSVPLRTSASFTSRSASASATSARGSPAHKRRILMQRA